MVLVTGPTGSGKTTTLYSALITSEPARIPRSSPPKIRWNTGSIASTRCRSTQDRPGLRARAAHACCARIPDIMLVGEMRDRETVEIGLRAAITGHLVFSTLHTLTPSATVNRLLDMGAPGYMIADGAARRAWRSDWCARCARTARSRPSHAESAGMAARCRPTCVADRQKFLAGAGCTYCNLSGYRGRAAIYELLEINRPLADAVRRGDLEGFARAARSSEGYVPLAQGTIDLALAGVTSLAEAMAVGSGLEEILDADHDESLPDSSVEQLLAQRA